MICEWNADADDANQHQGQDVSVEERIVKQALSQVPKTFEGRSRCPLSVKRSTRSDVLRFKRMRASNEKKRLAKASVCKAS